LIRRNSISPALGLRPGRSGHAHCAAGYLRR
jgi:hypothetical protein